MKYYFQKSFDFLREFRFNQWNSNVENYDFIYLKLSIEKHVFYSLERFA